jgi:hypothetical protein
MTKVKIGQIVSILLSMGPLVFSGCVMVVNSPNQVSNATLVTLRSVAAPCTLTDTERKKYGVIKTLASAAYITPDKAKQARMDGCAAAEFHINNSGLATSIHIVKESPTGYGYGEALVEQVKNSKYDTPYAADQWFFVSNATVLNKLAPIPPASPASPTK